MRSGGDDGHDTWSLEQDPRWRRLNGAPWRCAACQGTHQGLFDLVWGKPEPWPGSEQEAANWEVLDTADILTEDFCVLDRQHYFVRAVLLLPILGAPGQHFGFGVWSTLSEKNFRLYLDKFDDVEQRGLGPWFGWFSNRIAGYPDTLNLKCQVIPASNRQRPRIVLEPTEHPLAREQQEGITFDRVLEIYVRNGHDIRSSLLD